MALSVAGRVLSLPPREFFLFAMRWSFGSWLLYLGISKWIAGPAGFIGYMSSNFEQTWLPLVLVKITGWLIVILEPVLGVWLLSGKQERLAWIANAKLMFVLMLGQSILKEFNTVANNWQYLALAIACAALSTPQEKN